MTIRFDDSLLSFVEIVATAIDPGLVAHTVFIRDAEGKLSAVVDSDIGEERLAELEETIIAKLGAYARDEGAIRDKNSYGAPRLFKEGFGGRRVDVSGHSVAFLDRRTVGADWLLPPRAPSPIPRIAFASLKGGVGRSTTLAVLAAYLSSRGIRVLAVDLDLEAPGIGTMLINQDALPKYGTLDYLVENGLNGIDADFLRNCLGRSFLGETGANVSVIPAIGTATISNPEGAISKLGRAYLEDVTTDGKTISLTDQIREMLDQFTISNEFDIVLIDARAGLHETTAAALLGLGAEVLLFGANEPQTYLGYRLLLAHLSQFSGTDYDGWRDRLQFVQAKASGDPSDTTDAAAKFGELYSLIYGPEEIFTAPDELTEDDFHMVWADEDTEVLVADVREPVVLKVLDDSRYRGFDPLRQKTLLQNDLFAATFSEVIDWVNDIVPLLMEDGDV